MRISTIPFGKGVVAKNILVIGAPGIKTYRKNHVTNADEMLTVLHGSYCLIIIASLQNHKLCLYDVVNWATEGGERGCKRVVQIPTELTDPAC